MREQQHLRPEADVGQHLQRRVGARVVELDQHVVEEDRQRFGVGAVARDRGEAEGQEHRVAGALAHRRDGLGAAPARAHADDHGFATTVDVCGEAVELAEGQPGERRSRGQDEGDLAFLAHDFDSVDAYLRSRPKHPKEIDPIQLEARSFAAMINNRLPNSMDNRASAIEVQFEGPLGLSGNVDAVILPGPLADSPSLRERLVDARVHVLPYSQVDGLRPSEYVHTLFDVCYRYYVDLGILS